MSGSAPAGNIRNVLVAFDDATFGSDILQAAVELAADLHAELRGIYFENDMLLRAARLPFVREVTTGSGTIRPMDVASLQRAMNNRAEQVREVLQRWADLAKIPCSFAISRGGATRHELLRTAESDVVFFGCRSHVPSVRPPKGKQANRRTGPLVLVLSSSKRNVRALAAASFLARKHEHPIILVVLAREHRVFQQLSGEASQQLCKLELPHTLLPHPIASLSALVHIARSQRPDLLVLGRDCELLDDSALDLIVEELTCPVVLV